jgi:hypothetical protein
MKSLAVIQNIGGEQMVDADWREPMDKPRTPFLFVIITELYDARLFGFVKIPIPLTLMAKSTKHCHQWSTDDIVQQNCLHLQQF